MSKAYKDYIGAFLVGLAGFVLIAFGWPYYSKISDLNATIGARQNIFTERQAALTSVNNLKKDYLQKATDIKKINMILPTTKDSAGLVSVLDDISSKTGLQMIRLSIGELKNQNPATYSKISWDINTRGDYASLLVYLKSVEKNTRLLDIDALQISRDQDKLSFRVQGFSYFFNQ